MYIARLLLKEFKSFGGSHDLQLSPGFTAIVGPNGSGKSNILDALRWVLGDASPGRLRITRQSDLIFQGTADRKPANNVEVLLRLRDGECENSIRKRYSQDVGTFLAVDGRKIRVQDLLDFKRKWHLEAAQFAFIGQGEVADTISQKPFQRRAHLETLFGIDRYRKKRDDALSKLNSASEEFLRLQTLMADLNIRREEIAPEVSRAEEARRINELLEEERKNLYHGRRANLEIRISSLMEKSERWKSLLTAKSFWVKNWESAVAFFRSGKKAYFEHMDGLSAERSAAQEKLEGLRRQCFTSATALKSSKERLSVLNSEIGTVDEHLSRVDREVCDAENTRDDLAGIHDVKKRELSALEKEILEINQSLAEERLRQERLRSETARCEEATSQLRGKLLAMGSSVREICGSSGELNGEIEERLRERALVESTLAAVQEEQGKAIHIYADAYARCQDLAGRLQKLRRTCHQMDSEMDGLQETAENAIYPRPVQFLLSAVKLGKLKANIKPVVDSFSCPTSITMALEAFLGGRQFWLIVNDLEDAQFCIEELKRRKAGRATFLPLGRARPRHPARSFDLPGAGVVGWAIDLVDAEKKIAPAVEHLFGDLLIVENYEVGSSLIRKGARFPIVTVAGEVFQPSGTVSGGRQRRSAGALEVKSRIRELGMRLNEGKGQLDKLRSEGAEAEKMERAAALEKERIAGKLDEQEALLKRCLMRLKSMEIEKDRLERDRETLLGRIRETNNKRRELMHKRKKNEASLKECPNIPDEGDMITRVTSMRSEVVLIEERLRASTEMLNRICAERQRYFSSRKDLEEEKIALKRSLISNRNVLKSLGSRCYKIFRKLKDLDSKLADLQSSESGMSGKVECATRRFNLASGEYRKLQEVGQEREQSVERLRNSLSGLIDTWNGKYPYSGEGPAEEDLEQIGRSVKKFERKLNALGEYNKGALSEDSSIRNRLDFLGEQAGDVNSGIEELKHLIGDTDKQASAIFLGSLDRVDRRFNSLFQRLFGGGEAHLKPQEDENLWDAGIDIVARPPGKRLHYLAQLSGGEQSLTALALLFAAMEVAEVPIAVLDEVDAALDETNLTRLADMAREYSSSLQLIAMTHRRQTMEKADIMYGVTMSAPGLSQIVGVRLEDWR